MDCRTALMTMLAAVDYTAGACGVTEMVGAVLPKEVIELARQAVADEAVSVREASRGLDLVCPHGYGLFEVCPHVGCIRYQASPPLVWLRSRRLQYYEAEYCYAAWKAFGLYGAGFTTEQVQDLLAGG
jgi:hypothetical protein